MIKRSFESSPAESEPADFSAEQKKIISALESKVRNNIDFISFDTYRRLFDELGIEKEDKILDLGAGFIAAEPHASRYTEALDQKGARVISLDKNFLASLSWLLHPRTRRYEGESMASPVNADAFRLPFRENTFKGVVSINLINSLLDHADLPLLLQEAYRTLRPEGFMIISTFGYLKIKKANGDVSYNNGFGPHEIISVSEIIEAAKSLGFRDISGLELSQQIMDREKEEIAENYEKKNEPLSQIKIVEPAGLLLRK